MKTTAGTEHLYLADARKLTDLIICGSCPTRHRGNNRVCRVSFSFFFINFVRYDRCLSVKLETADHRFGIGKNLAPLGLSMIRSSLPLPKLKTKQEEFVS